MEKAVSVSEAHNSHRDKSSETHGHSRSTTPAESHIPSSDSTHASDDSALMLDWDGPDDPENPRK